MVKSFTASVVALKEEGLFVATKELEFINRLELGTEISIAYVHGDGQKYMFGTYKVAHILRESPVLILAKPWKVNYSLLRRHFRFNLEMPLYYLLHGDVHIGQVIDLSACGALAVVNSDPQIAVGAQIAFQIKFPNFDPFLLKGEIKRTEDLGEGKTEIALDFLNAGEEVHQQISKCLLQSIYQPPE
ncbi:MAG TPA: PilZ domain-containing protein [Bacillota bacterium]|nr:PilZ domain-containing protein [Bacillota bacterium]